MRRALDLFMTHKQCDVETGQMSSGETRKMSAVETGQMSAAETRQMSAVETRQMLKSQIRGRASQQQWGLSKARPSPNPG